MPKYNFMYENGVRTLDAANENAAAELAMSVWGEAPESISLAVEEAVSPEVKELHITASLVPGVIGELAITSVGTLTIMPEKGYLTLELPREEAEKVADRIATLQAMLTLAFPEIVE